MLVMMIVRGGKEWRLASRVGACLEERVSCLGLLRVHVNLPLAELDKWDEWSKLDRPPCQTSEPIRDATVSSITSGGYKVEGNSRRQQSRYTDRDP